MAGANHTKYSIASYTHVLIILNMVLPSIHLLNIHLPNLYMYQLGFLVHKRGQKFSKFLVVFVLRFGVGMEA